MLGGERRCLVAAGPTGLRGMTVGGMHFPLCSGFGAFT